MTNDLNIHIKINSDTKQLEITQDGFEKIRKKANDAVDPIERLTGRIASMGHAAIIMVGVHKTLDMVIASGIRLNSQFEQMKLGIASLIAVNSSNTTAMGKHITAVEKFAMAQAQAADSVELLRKANTQTPATLAQITEGYQAALGPAMRLGLSSKQTVEYVKLMTMAAAAMGAPMEQIAQESRALLAGEIDMNAQVARNLQITNKQVEMHTKQGDLYEWLTKKLGDFAAGGEAMANSWAGISSNLEDTFDTIRVNATEKLFNAIKGDAKDLTSTLNENITLYSDTAAKVFYSVYGIGKVSFEGLSGSASMVWDSLKLIGNGIVLLYNKAWAAVGDGFDKYVIQNIIYGVKAVNSLLPGSAQISLETLDKVHNLINASVVKSKDAVIMTRDGMVEIGKHYTQTAADMDKTVTSAIKGYLSIGNTVSAIKNSDALKPGDKPKDEEKKTSKGKTAAQIEAEELRAVTNRLDLQQTAQIDYYKTVGDASSVFAIEEADKLQKLAQSGMLSNEQMIAVWDVDNKAFLKRQNDAINEYMTIMSNLKIDMKDTVSFNAIDAELAKQIDHINAMKYSLAPLSAPAFDGSKTLNDIMSFGSQVNAASYSLSPLNSPEFDGSKTIGDVESFASTIDAMKYSLAPLSAPAFDGGPTLKKIAAFNTEITRIESVRSLMQDDRFTNDFAAIDKQIEKFKEQGRTETQIAEYTALAIEAVRKKANDKRLESEKSYYASVLQLSGDWYTSESIKIGEQYNEWEKAGIDKLQLQEWLNASMLSLDKKRYDDQLELAKKSYEEDNRFWINLFGNSKKAMDNQLFDAMVGKWTSFGNWFKDFWSSLSTSVMRALPAQLSNSITGSIKEMLLGSADAGGAQNIFKTYGGFSGALGFSAPAALAGASTDSAGFTTTTGGTVFDAAGQITKQGSDASDVLSALSSAKSLYSVITGGISDSIMTGFSSFGSSTASLLQSMGFTQAGATANMGISQFGAGLATPWSSAGAGGIQGSGAMLGGAAIGAAGGYALGSIGDKIFGADTKASTYGAIGGAIGSLAGPLGAVAGAAIGSAIGGMFGKKKSDGITIEGSATSDYADGHFDYVKKSWFSTKRGISSWFSDKDKEAITGVIGSYDYLLVQMGVLDKKLAISGGKFSSIQDFLDRGVAKTFIDTITTADTTEMYDAWSDYAKSINKTIQSALTDSINTYVGDTRNFQTWMLERSGNSLESLKLKSEWASADTVNLQKMLGLEGVTVDNYLSKYKDAISNSFDPQTLQNYKTLGEQLMSNAEAADAYTQALKDQAAVTARLRPADMMLSLVSDTTQVTGQSDGTVTKQLLDAFNQLIRAIDKQNTLTQLTTGRI